MDPVIRRLKIESIKAQMVLCELSCESLAKEFEVESLSEAQRSEIADRLDGMIEERRVLLLALDVLERQQTEEKIGC